MSYGACATIFKFITWIRSKSKNEIESVDILKDILTKDKWNLSDMSEKYSISQEQCKCFLKGCGYKWDNKSHSYIKTYETINFINRKNKTPGNSGIVTANTNTSFETGKISDLTITPLSSLFHR